MWSDRFYYLNICKDLQLSKSCSTKTLIKFISSFSEIEQVNDFKYKNSSSFPFVEMLLLNTENIDSWSEKNVSPTNTNLIAIVCSKQNVNDFKKIKNILLKISTFLNWQLINEQTDDGVENYILSETKEPND